MHKIIVVAVREYLAAVRSKAFLITILLAPILMSAGFIAEKVMDKRGLDISDRHIAVLDHSGKLFDKLAAAAELRNAVGIYSESTESDGPEQVAPRFLLERVEITDDDQSEKLLRLSERVRDGELLAFVEVGPNVLDPASPDDPEASVRYYTNATTYSESRRWLTTAMTTAAQEWRFAESGLDAKKVRWALVPPPVEQLGLLERDPITGQIAPAQKVDAVTSTLVPILMVVLLFMVIMMAAGPLVQSVLEEKLQRIAEVLLGSIDPFGWMLGKLIGMVGVSFTIVAIYLGGGLIIASERGYLASLPLHLLGWFVVYQVLAVLMYGSVFVGVGAACKDHREAQTALTPLMVVIMIPMFILQRIISEPNSTFATVLSFVPPVTPVVMLTRQAIPPGIPAWQPVVGAVLVLLTTVLCIFAAGRVFRVGILIQGDGARFRDIIGWLIRG